MAAVIMLRGFSSGLKNKRHIQCQIILLLLWWKLNPQRRVAPLREKVASKLIPYSSVLLTNPGATRTFCGAAKVLLMLSATQPKGELI